MIRFRNVTKYYDTKDSRKYILNGCTATLEAQRGIAILGRNGAGKSTLVRMISGAELPNSGKIERTGQVSWPMGISGTFAPAMTARDNVVFVARIYGRDEHEVVRAVEEFAELGDYMDMAVRTFSSGMKSRLAFGLSLAIRFDVLLIDEIFAVGDKRFQKRSRKRLMQAAKQSKVIVVSHQVKTIKDLCDKVAVLEDGNLVMFDDIDEGIRYYEKAHQQ